MILPQVSTPDPDGPKFIGLFKVPSPEKLPLATDRKVDFVVAGTEKGGTSALDAYLRLDPQICMPKKTKEVRFFATDPLFSSGEPDYRVYHAFFKPKTRHRLLGEVTPGYVWRGLRPPCPRLQSGHEDNPQP